MSDLLARAFPATERTAPPRALDVASGAADAAEQHAREPLPGQPILVVHRRLVHDVQQTPFPGGGAGAEENRGAAAHHGDRRPPRADVDEQPVGLAIDA